MRSKEEVLNTSILNPDAGRNVMEEKVSGKDRLFLEVLLDIRDLLAKAANPLYQIKDGGRIEIVDSTPTHHE